MGKVVKHYVLKEDNNSYYVSEGVGTRDYEKAKTFNSLEEIIKTVPIMKDWNWDYKVYSVSEIKFNIGEITHYDEQKLVDEKKWMTIYKKWKVENPEEYDALYNVGGGFKSFIKVINE
jgi:hypothetical protein